MASVSSIPYLSPQEFEAACKKLSDVFAARRQRQDDWLSVELVQCLHGKYLKITKLLERSESLENDSGSERDEFEEEDEVCSITLLSLGISVIEIRRYCQLILLNEQ